MFIYLKYESQFQLRLLALNVYQKLMILAFSLLFTTIPHWSSYWHRKLKYADQKLYYAYEPTITHTQVRDHKMVKKH